jgi:hypothetical protein
VIALDEIREFLNVDEDDHDDDDLLDRLEDEAVEIVQSYTGQSYALTGEITEYIKGFGTDSLFLSQNAAADPTEVLESAYAGDAGTEVTDWVRRGNRLIRASGGVWHLGYEYTVTYEHGYAEDAEPANVRLAVKRIVAALYQQRGIEGMKSVQHGPNYSVSRDSDAIKAILVELPYKPAFA